VASDPAIGNLTKALDVLGPLCLFDPMTKDRDNCPSSLSEPGTQRAGLRRFSCQQHEHEQQE